MSHSGPAPRLLVIADVGGDATRHLGDEAMLEVNLDGFRRAIPGVTFTVVSRDPAWTAARYSVEAVAPFGFPRDRAASVARGDLLATLLAQAARSPAPSAPLSDPMSALSRAVALADGVVVSGGGNLSSNWPDLLYERVALLQLARSFGKPAVVLGQTLGPSLGGDELHLLTEALSSARFLGVRELPSAALAAELGVPLERIWYQSDDALVVEDEAAGTVRQVQPTIAVTIDPQLRAAGETLFDALALQLREIAESTGAFLTLVPHAFGEESSGVPSDLTEARLLAERISLGTTVIAEGLDAGAARRLTAGAAMVISGRYHPIVFAMGAAVPSLAIHGDEYCRIKLEGVLTHAGLQRWAITYSDVARQQLTVHALALWNEREAVRAQAASRHAAWAEEAGRRWVTVVRALRSVETSPIESASVAGTLFGRPATEIALALVQTVEARRRAWERQRDEHEQDVARYEQDVVAAEGYARYLEHESTVRRSARQLRAALRRIRRRRE